jgi:uncharacterized membrane protein
MNREEYIEICSLCLNRNFNPKLGLICSLTNEQASFTEKCLDYSEDEQEVRASERKKKDEIALVKNEVRKGSYALFYVGGVQFLWAIYEGFLMNGHQFSFAVVGFVIALVFSLLGFWSLKKPLLALPIGTGFYLLLHLLVILVNPSLLLQGIILKILVFIYLIYSIISAKSLSKMTN